jgi:hypothetical protein
MVSLLDVPKRESIGYLMADWPNRRTERRTKDSMTRSLEGDTRSNSTVQAGGSLVWKALRLAVDVGEVVEAGCPPKSGTLRPIRCMVE